MKLPRVLVILIVIVVVLQVLSCGVAVERSGETATPSLVPELLQDIGPEPPPVDLADVAACQAIPASGVIQFPAACRIVVEPASGSVRRLTLELVAGAVTMSVSANPDRERALDSEEVNVPPDEQVEVDLACGLPPCRVRLGD